MTQMGVNPIGPSRSKATHNIYTVLMFIALAAIVFGIAFIWIRSSQLFDSPHPFELKSVSTAIHQFVRTLV